MVWRMDRHTSDPEGVTGHEVAHEVALDAAISTRFPGDPSFHRGPLFREQLVTSAPWRCFGDEGGWYITDS